MYNIQYIHTMSYTYIQEHFSSQNPQFIVIHFNAFRLKGGNLTGSFCIYYINTIKHPNDQESIVFFYNIKTYQNRNDCSNCTDCIGLLAQFLFRIKKEIVALLHFFCCFKIYITPLYDSNSKVEPLLIFMTFMVGSQTQKCFFI